MHEHIQFIDTSPWKEFPVMHRLYVKTCHLVMIVYNVTALNWAQMLKDMIEEVRAIRGKYHIALFTPATGCQCA